MTATTDPTTNGTGPAGDRTSTRMRILEAAMDLFAEDGFSGTTISALERRVGLAASSGSLTAVAEAAIGGYHLFSLMQGRPYNGVAEDTFLRALVASTLSGHDMRTA